MYTILVTDSNELTTTVKERIMQRSKLVDNLHFLVEQTYKEMDMADFTVTLEYVLPSSKEYCTEDLTLSDELYKDEYLEYTLPLDTTLTKEAGTVEMQLTFTLVDMDEDGNTVQYVRKTSTGTLVVVPIAAWSDIVPDSALTALDQRILKIQAIAEAIEETQDTLENTKADDMTYEDFILTLKGNGNTLATADLSDLSDECDCTDNDTGMVVVTF